jgi:hypothetical protein
MSMPLREPLTDESNRRQHYRVEYPAHDRPAFIAGPLRGAVSDCSQTGVRVLFPAGLPTEAGVLMGDRMSAEIRFARGESEEVEGTVMRYDGKTLVLQLDVRQLPFGRIMREQLWLRSRYPWRDEK